MKMLKLSLRHKYFAAIKSGFKTVEGRINSVKFKTLKVGDTMSFTSVETSEVLYCRVQAINIYKNFEDMLLAEGVENMLPGVKDIKSGVAIYENFPGYKDKVEKVGVVAVRILVDIDC